MKLRELGKTGRAWVLCNCGQLLVAVDRYVTDFPPIPRGKNPESFVEFYLDEGGDPDDLVSQCPACEDYLELASVARAGALGGPTISPPR